MNEGNHAGPIGPRQSISRMAYDESRYLYNVSRTGVPLDFNELSRPNLHRDAFSSLWSKQPFEQLFGMPRNDQNDRPGIAPKETFSYADAEAKLLQSLRFCIMKLLKLEGSDWLFKQNGGFDEELIDELAAGERYLQEMNASEKNPTYMGESSMVSDVPSLLSLPNCGDNCIWRAALVVSFGVWCIRRILEMALVESRPELWGKYTYDLNRLQGIIEPAFSKRRHPLTPCTCFDTPSRKINSLNPTRKAIIHGTPLTTAFTVLDIVKDVEAAVSGRKGRTGTASGDVAFPKGKENMASVLKRYKRRPANKSPWTQEITGPSHRISGSAIL